jgi:hypothetical protein
MNGPYAVAQTAMAQLKGAIYQLLQNGPPTGLRNADIGRSLGIYGGHVEHEGHISRVLLGMMEKEGVVSQNPETKLWTVKLHGGSKADEAFETRIP